VRIELVFKKILPAYHNFPGEQMLNLFQIGLFSRGEETHVSLQRKPSRIVKGASSALFHCEN
jgi:hypothetical protein